ncbi:Zn-ribbon domain-containing OB-fold protein [Pseudoteredinibacter isoporae]|uniref:Zn-ribbon domain-containing OB-fold protein n=1 Tax=Pseudoteredinibacter isoporae TaxID=570281 RepID=UPI0031039970
MSDSFSQSLPPRKRTVLGEQLQPFAEKGELHLQHCGACQQWSYPPRELCGHCLADALSWQLCSGEGQVLSRIDLHNSFEAYFSEQLPWSLLSVKLDIGPVLYVHGEGQSGQRVNVKLQLDAASAPVFRAE